MVVIFRTARGTASAEDSRRLVFWEQQCGQIPLSYFKMEQQIGHPTFIYFYNVAHSQCHKSSPSHHHRWLVSSPFRVMAG